MQKKQIPAGLWNARPAPGEAERKLLIKDSRQNPEAKASGFLPAVFAVKGCTKQRGTAQQDGF